MQSIDEVIAVLNSTTATKPKESTNKCGSKVYKWETELGLLSLVDDKEEDIEFIDSYGFAPDYCIVFRVYNNEESSAQLVRLLNNILQKTSVDMVLEFNGEFPVIIRTNGQVQVNHAFDDGTNFPFSELSMTTEIIHRDVE